MKLISFIFLFHFHNSINMTHGEGWPFFHGASCFNVRKTGRIKALSDVNSRAVAMVLHEGKSVSRVAMIFNIPRIGLAKYVQKNKIGLIVTFYKRSLLFL
jgi:hypothetical protein